MPEGAVYLWVDCSLVSLSDIEIADILLQRGVAVVPGSCFGDMYNNFLRVSLGQDESKLLKGIKIISNTINNLEGEDT